MTEFDKYSEMFDYLSEVPAPEESAGLLVFGRKDLLVAQAAGDTIMRGLADYVIITGGVGKDSGDLTVPEAEFLRDGLLEEVPGITIPVLTETKATNGGENVRNSLAMLDETELSYQPSLTTVIHATSARRLMELTRHEAIKRDTPIENLRGIATAYQFDPTNPTDQKEARAELLRMADWPAKGWLQPQTDVPENLVDFARDVNPG